MVTLTTWLYLLWLYLLSPLLQVVIPPQRNLGSFYCAEAGALCLARHLACAGRGELGHRALLSHERAGATPLNFAGGRTLVITLDAVAIE